MALPVSLSIAPNADIPTAENGLLTFTPRAKQSSDPEGDQLQLLEDTLSCLQKLYDGNAELNRELEIMGEKLNGAEQLAEKWQRLAATAITKAKDIEDRAKVAELQLQGEKDRAEAAERRAQDSEGALVTHKERFASKFDKFDHAREIIKTLQGGAVPSIAGTHFRVVRKSSGWGD